MVSESGVGNEGEVGATALLELGVGQIAVKLDGGGRRAEVLDRQFGGGGWGGAGAFFFLRLAFDRVIVIGMIVTQKDIIAQKKSQN